MTVPKYPVEISDQEGIVDGLNYLLSGPAGLGQNFQGFSSFQPVYIRPTVRPPFTLPLTTTLNTSWTVTIPISNAAPVGGNPSNEVIFTFATPQTNPPFQFGDLIDITGVIDTGTDTPYDDFNYRVLSCTTTDVTVYTSVDYVWNTYSSGGNIIRDFNNFTISTDCNAFVTVTGPTDRVFVTAQIDLSYTNVSADTGGGGPYDLLVQINRYVGTPNSLTQNNPNDFAFDFQQTVAQQLFPLNTGSVTSPDERTSVFTTAIDGPNLAPGFYWYILEVAFVNKPEQIAPDVVNDFSTNGYNSQAGELVEDGFYATGLMSQVPAPGTTYAGIALTGGSGIGAVADITVYPDPLFPGYDISLILVEVPTPGAGYKIGDVFTIPGTSLGGTTPENDLTLTVLEVQYIPSNPGFPPAQCGVMVANNRSLTAQVIKQ
jgi:hypothetical protein